MGEPLRILVADDDAWILRMVTTVLEKRGYRVDTATDGREALDRATASPPDLVITDVMMPRMDGWELVRALRARPEFAFVPVIFLTALSSDDDRIRGFRLGADDYLPKPFRFEELDLRVANTLRRTQMIERAARERIQTVPAPPPPPAKPDGSGAFAIAGSLAQIGLSSLLTLLELERKSGVLTLRAAGGGDTARIWLRDGRVVQAEIDGRDAPRDEECIYHLLTWSDGSFDFDSQEVDRPDRVGQTTTHLLMEGARRLDEHARAM
ncbi:MAG: response regulator [Deltaproteobacteria bacterium]|nr:MAG: response regulator [Deltaproteobacteria bacterium]